MKNRLWTEGALTTILGLGTLAAAGYVIYTDMENGQTAQEAITAVGGWIATGGILLRAKSTILTDIFKGAGKSNDNSQG